MKIRSLYLPVLLTVILLLPTEVFACACCADEGYYRLSVHNPTEYEMGEMQKLSFSDSQIYATPGFPDDIKGIENRESEKYTVNASIGGDDWAFSFTNAEGKTGTLKLRTPKKFVDYAVDTRNKENIGAGSVNLYKEWRFKTKVKSGTGIFAGGASRKRKCLHKCRGFYKLAFRSYRKESELCLFRKT